MSFLSDLQADGYVVVPGVFSPVEIAHLLAGWEEVQRDNTQDESLMGGENRQLFAARNLLRIWPGVEEIARRTAIGEHLISALGSEAGIVRGLFFDKPPGNSWALPWHKDYMVAVKAHGKEGVFTHPGMAGVIPQVKAPKELLEKMLTVRVHLDDMDEENGALRVIPGSHEYYAMNEDAATEPVTIKCKAGDVLFMRPLLTHASGRGKQEGLRHRRVLHLECAPSPRLSDGYEWHDFISLLGN